MKKFAVCGLMALVALGSALAGPIKGLVDVGTGKEVPDADLRYLLVGSPVPYALFAGYATNSGTAGYATNETLVTITARGSNTAENITLSGLAITIGDGAGTRVNQGMGVNFGRVGAGSVQSIGSYYATWNFGNVALNGTQTNNATGSINLGKIFGNQIMTGYGSLNVGDIDVGEFQNTSGNGSINVGANNTNSHDHSAVFGCGINSVETNSVAARKYYATQAYMPATGNTVDLGSIALPFRHLYVGGGTIYMDGIAMFSVTNGELVVAYPIVNSNGVSYVVTNLFAGAGTTGLVTSATGNTNQYLRGDGTWQNVAASGAGDVFRGSNNVYSVGTTQSMDYLLINDMTGNTLTVSNGAFVVLSASGSFTPATSNTVDIGSLAMPFSGLYLGTNSIYMAGTKALSYSNGNLVAQIPLVNSSGVSYSISTLFAGSGTTGSVTSVSGDAGKFLRADGTWQTAGGGTGSGNVNTASNNTYSVGTTQSMPNAIITSELDVFGNMIMTNGGVAIGSTVTTNAKVYIVGESGAYTNKPLLWLNRSASATGPILQWGTNGVTEGYIDVNGIGVFSGISGWGNLTFTNTGVAFGSAVTTNAKVYVTGESGTYTNKPLLWLNRSASATGPIVQWGTNGVVIGSIDVNGNAIFNNTTIGGSLTFGGVTMTSISSNTPLYADGSQAFNAVQNGGGYGITNVGHLVPAASNAYDLGTAALPWRNAYYVSHTIFMGGHPLSMDDNTGKLSVPGVLYSIPQYTMKSVAASDMMLRGAATDPAWDGIKVRMTFSGTNLNGVSFICDLPQYSPDTDIVPLILWEGNADSAADVIWQTDYIWRNINDVSTYGDWNTLMMTNASPSAKWKTKVSRFPTIIGTGKKKNSILQVRLQRRGDLDTNNDTVSLLFFGLRYAIQSTGEDAQ